MTISFNNIPASLRVPLFYAEIDPSMANTGAGGNQRTLIIGQITASGIAAPNAPILSQGVADAVKQGGPGSMLALMVDKYRQNDLVGEVWLLPVSDAGGGTAATGTIAFTAAPTVNGTLYLNIGDVLLLVALTSSMTITQIATAVAAAINANVNLPITATSAVGVVTVTAKNKGLAQNDVALVINNAGAAGGQSSPTGLAYTITAMSGGAGNPILTTALGNLGDMPFDFIVLPYFDTVSLDAMKALLNDTAGRWSYATQVYGHCFAASYGNLAAAQTLGASRNDQHMTILAENGSVTPHWLWAPSYVGAAAVALKADPARPLQTIIVNGVQAPPLASRFQLTDRNTLLFTGISTFSVQADGTVRLENIVTTYQVNAYNQPDNSYLEVETMFQLMFLLRDLKADITSRFPRAKLAATVARLAPGTGVVTPDMIKAEMIAHYRLLEYNGQAQDSNAFAAGLVVQQNPTNHNRVDVLWDGTIMNQLRIFAVLFQFRQ